MNFYITARVIYVLKIEIFYLFILSIPLTGFWGNLFILYLSHLSLTPRRLVPPETFTLLLKIVVENPTTLFRHPESQLRLCGQSLGPYYTTTESV